MKHELHAVEWTGSALLLIDQTALPQAFERLEIRDVDALVDAIARLAVRGAPAIGAAGAYGVAIALLQSGREGWTGDELAAAVARIRAARPTAINLAVCVDRVAPLIGQGLDAVLNEAHAVVREDLEANYVMARAGADWLLKRVAADRPLRVLTHCNTGALATAGWGTALGVVRELHRRGLLEMVYVDETRPLLQGARLTAWELAHEGIPHRVQVDGAAASVIVSGSVDAAVVGADRITMNGDTANKIGTLGIALACDYADIPFMVAAPTTTLDVAAVTGESIHIEMRDEAEVLGYGGLRSVGQGTRGHNPAFDVTPGRLVSALVSERGVLEVASGELPGERWQ
ncbi:S-methyl-5-thioribose-1-phosphate isomerase [Streptomyces sp. NPDC006129]|uniref:S-methyl-5-thioribose-1-phosphate isomerase n=1 Tax=Streptomyces sp. NPDC006129 TaxID=3155348 RepID=UPI0033BE7891